MNQNVLNIENLNAVYATELYGIKREVRAINDVSFGLRRNEVFGIAGESGSGKTTLLKLLSGTHRAPLTVRDGSVTYNFALQEKSLNILDCSRRALDEVRWKNLSYVMQGSMNVLNPVRKVGKSFTDFAFPHMNIPDKDTFEKAVVEYLAKLRLPAEVIRSYPHELSGGMRQRVIIALATICSPEVIIADEPTTALDVVVQRETLNLLKDIQDVQKNTILLITHDMAVHANIADRIGIMYAGRIVEEGKTRDIFNAPGHPYTQHLIRSLPRIGDSSRKIGLEGNPPNLASPPPGCPFHPRCPKAKAECSENLPAPEVVGEDHRVACFYSEL